MLHVDAHLVDLSSADKLRIRTFLVPLPLFYMYYNTYYYQCQHLHVIFLIIISSFSRIIKNMDKNNQGAVASMIKKNHRCGSIFLSFLSRNVFSISTVFKKGGL